MGVVYSLELLRMSWSLSNERFVKYGVEYVCVRLPVKLYRVLSGFMHFYML